ncbi:MAG: hypothetical protein V2G50_08290 [bacterium JZ-2024 1]
MKSESVVISFFPTVARPYNFFLHFAELPGIREQAPSHPAIRLNPEAPDRWLVLGPSENHRCFVSGAGFRMPIVPTPFPVCHPFAYLKIWLMRDSKVLIAPPPGGLASRNVRRERAQDCQYLCRPFAGCLRLERNKMYRFLEVWRREHQPERAHLFRGWQDRVYRHLRTRGFLPPLPDYPNPDEQALARRPLCVTPRSPPPSARHP